MTDDTLQRIIATLGEMEKYDVPVNVNLLETQVFDSLNLLELIERLEEAFGIELDLSAQDPDRFMRLTGLAEVIDEASRGVASSTFPKASDSKRDEHVPDRAAIRRASSGDIPRLSQLAMYAYQSDPLVRWLYPHDSEYFDGDGRVLRHSLRRWLAWDETYVSGEIAALAAWIPPNRPLMLVPREPADGPLPIDCIRRFRALDSALAKHTPADAHWYLNMLATDPDRQGQGHGQSLVRSMLSRAHDEKLGCYLETATMENVEFYRKLGFSVQSEFDVSMGGPHMWGMWHDA